MDILAKLFWNPGLVHVADQIVSFLDDKSVAQCRLVSRNYNEFLMNIWRNRALKEAHRQCEIKCKFFTSEYNLIETSIFDSWPHWKIVLKEINLLEVLSDVIYFFKQFVEKSKPREREIIINEEEDWHHYSPLSTPFLFMIRHHDSYFKERNKIERFFGALLETSLDFNECDERLNTPLHVACDSGSEVLVEFILNNAVKKGINLKAVNINNDSIVHSSIHHEEVLKHLFERRKEFDFDISQEYDGGENILFAAVYYGQSNETFEIILKWAMEEGISVDEVDYDNENVLHAGCNLKPEMALFFLENCEKYGLKETVTSMVNMANQNGERPIDCLTGIEGYDFDENVVNQLITELEKYKV